MAKPTSLSAEQFRHLLEEARSGSKPALGQLLETCRPYLLFLANRYLPQELRVKVDCPDFVQETYLKACQRFPTFRGQSRQELRAWLRQILRNRISSFLYAFQYKKRATVRERSLDSPEGRQALAVPDGSCPDSELQRQETCQLVNSVLSELPATDRDALQLRYRDDLSYQELGNRLELSAPGARDRGLGALAKMRKRCRKWGLAADEAD